MFNADKTINTIGIISKEIKIDVEIGGYTETITKTQNWPVANIITSQIQYKEGETTKTIDKTHLTYIVGAKLSNLDAWDKKTYGSELLVFRCDDFTDTQLSEITFGNKQTPMVKCVSTNEYALIGLTSNPTMKIAFSNIFFNNYFIGKKDIDNDENEEEYMITILTSSLSAPSSIELSYSSGYELEIEGYDTNLQEKSESYIFVKGQLTNFSYMLK